MAHVLMHREKEVAPVIYGRDLTWQVSNRDRYVTCHLLRFLKNKDLNKNKNNNIFTKFNVLNSHLHRFIRGLRVLFDALFLTTPCEFEVNRRHVYVG